MKSVMEMRVEILAGTNFKDAVKEAKNKAILFNLAFIKFDFNGIGISISQKADVELAYEKYTKACGNAKFKYVIE